MAKQVSIADRTSRIPRHDQKTNQSLHDPIMISPYLLYLVIGKLTSIGYSHNVSLSVGWPHSGNSDSLSGNFTLVLLIAT